MGEQIKKKRTRVGGTSAPKNETRGREHKPLIARVKPPTEDAVNFNPEQPQDALKELVAIIKDKGFNVTEKDILYAHRLNTVGIAYKPRKEDSPKTRRQKKRMLVALEMSLGVCAPALKMVGIPRSSHDKWMLEDEDYKQFVLDLEVTAVDFTETQMLQKIRAGNEGMIKFYMVTKGKDRGYNMSVASSSSMNDVPQIRLTKRYVDPQGNDIQDATLSD